MKQFNKVLIVSLAFFLFFFFFGLNNFLSFGSVNNTIDFETHFKKIQDFSYAPNYPSLYHYLFFFTKGNSLFLYFSNLVLICLIIPILLYFGTKTWWASLIYFVGISLPHMWIYGATYPQALVFLFLIIYLLNRRNLLIFGICALLASFAHREGMFLFVLVLFAEVVDYFARLFYKKYLSGITPFFPAVVLGVEKFSNFPRFLFFLLTAISLPLWIYAKKVFYNPFWLTLFIVPFIIFDFDIRLISLPQLVLVFVAGPEIAKARHKKILLLIFAFYLAFYLLEFGLGTIKIINTS